MSEINKILEKNLEYIATYDNDLCEKLASIKELNADIQLVYSHKNEANLAINGIAINEQSGVVDEANRLVGSLKHNSKNSIFIVLGMGFGYLFSKTVEYSKGSVILYEPNIELLRVALEMVDMSQYLSKEHVFITNDLSKIEKYFASCFLPNTQTSVLACSYYKIHDLSELNSLIKKLSVLQGIYETNTKQRAYLGHSYALSVCKNLFDFKTCSCITQLKDVFKNKPAIIAAAGPSLSDNLDLIKQYRNNFILFGVSSSFASLMKNEISPDFVSVIEKFDATSLLKNFDLKNINLISEPIVNNNILNLPFKNKFISISVENSANSIYKKLYNIENYYFETKGTVAYNALFAAKFMGCNPIILVGQDLAYVDGECYSTNSPLSPIKCRKTDTKWEIYVSDMNKLKENVFSHKQFNEEQVLLDINNRIKNLNKQLTITHTEFGEEIPTSSTFALFAEYYKHFAKENSYLTLYNTSKKGIKLDGFEYKSLKDILNSLTEEVNTKTQNYDFIYQTNEINTNFINKEIKFLEDICANIQKLCPANSELADLLNKKEMNEKLIRATKYLLKEFITIHDKGIKSSTIYKEITMETTYAINSIHDKLNELNLNSISKLKTCIETLLIKDKNRLLNALEILKQIKKDFENETGVTES